MSSQYMLDNFGRINSPKSFMKAEEKVKKKKSELCRIFQLDDGNYIVAIVDNYREHHI